MRPILKPTTADLLMQKGPALGRMAEPEEIANAVVFLASAKASYVTGVTLTMDGAQTPVVV